jgi:hypothetical protein
MGRRAGKMSKVTAQALLSLLVWSEWMIRSNSPELLSGDQNNRDNLQPSRNILRAIFLRWANLRVAILSVAWGWCCSTVARVKVLQEAPCELCFWFAHLVHEKVQKGLKGAKRSWLMVVTMYLCTPTNGNGSSATAQDINTSADIMMDEPPIPLPTRPISHWIVSRNCEICSLTTEVTI